MKKFFTGTTNDSECEQTKKLESFKNENKALKQQLGASVTLDSDHATNAKKLKEMLAVVEVLRQLEAKELVTDVTDSDKCPGYLSVAVLDAKTRKPVLAIVAEGKDKKERSKFRGYGSLSFYEYNVHKATFAFVKDSVNIKVPSFLLEEVSWKLTDHITEWSDAHDKNQNAKLDTVLAKLGA